MKNVYESIQKSLNSNDTSSGTEKENEEQLSVEEIIKNYHTSTADFLTRYYQDFEDLKSNPQENKKEILDILEKSLKDSTLIDLGGGWEGITGMIRFAKSFGVKKYINIDIATYTEEFKKEFASKEGIETQLIEDDYLRALANMLKGNYNFIFFNPPYLISEDMSDPKTGGANYWKMFFKLIGELTPKKHILLTDTSTKFELDVFPLIESNGFKYIGKIKDDGFSSPAVFVKL